MQMVDATCNFGRLSDLGHFKMKLMMCFVTSTNKGWTIKDFGQQIDSQRDH